MTNKTNEIDLFTTVLSSVLEKMAFIFTEELSTEELLADPGECLGVEIRFQGPHKGQVNLVAQFPLGKELAANMLGTDEEEITEEMVCDALKEVLNMACGQFLTARYGSEPVFNLSVPEVNRVEAGTWVDISSRPDSRVLEAENWQLVASISMEDEN